jgi:hypothetical protein
MSDAPRELSRHDREAAKAGRRYRTFQIHRDFTTGIASRSIYIGIASVHAEIASGSSGLRCHRNGEFEMETMKERRFASEVVSGEK